MVWWCGYGAAAVWRALMHNGTSANLKELNVNGTQDAVKVTDTRANGVPNTQMLQVGHGGVLMAGLTE